MDKLIDSRFERLEKALAGLIDSVTKYHPSVALAKELELADEELSRGLEQVQTHQNNYLRIQKLRETSSALDSQIRDTLTTLANTRKDIVTTQTTTYPEGPNYPIAYGELLEYARRISKTTLPPSGIINNLPPLQQPASGAETPAAGPDSQPQSALTPGAPTPSQTQSPAVVNGASSQPGSAQPTQQTGASVDTSLPEHLSQQLDPLTGYVFFPWPTEQKIRAGALASTQMLLEQGIDPKGYDPVAEQKRKEQEEAERKEKEEREKKEREEKEKRMREEREKLRKEREAQREKEREEFRRGTMAGPGSVINQAASGGQFQFASMDDDDD